MNVMMCNVQHHENHQHAAPAQSNLVLLCYPIDTGLPHAGYGSSPHRRPSGPGVAAVARTFVKVKGKLLHLHLPQNLGPKCK